MQGDNTSICPWHPSTNFSPGFYKLTCGGWATQKARRGALGVEVYTLPLGLLGNVVHGRSWWAWALSAQAQAQARSDGAALVPDSGTRVLAR